MGRAIARRRQQEGWKGKFTVYSTDEHKHAYMRKMFPDVNFVQGDIRNPETLYNAMVGHDLCIHAGAVKVIPVSEECCIDTVDVNIYGSQNVFMTAVRANIQHILSISTDKACRAANLYGATKYAMEKISQEYTRAFPDINFHLVRYGNVLESTGSVIEAWKRQVVNGEAIKMTDPTMTRFWLSPAQAVDYVIRSLDYPSGHIYIPKMPALAIGVLAQYVLEDYEIELVPLRPGEKIHETLLTCEEGHYATETPEEFELSPTTSTRFEYGIEPYSSDIARQLTYDELAELLKNE